MTQVSNQVSMACGKVEISSDAASWTDISGATNTLSDNEQTVINGEIYTLDGNTAIIGAGKKEPLEPSINIVYNETDADAYETVRELFEQTGCDNAFYVRVTPRGDGAGYEQLTSGEGRLTGFTYPQLDAASGDPIMGGFKFKIPGWTTTIVDS